jgi:hypothetical protein
VTPIGSPAPPITSLEELPGWRFVVEEVSAGVYRLDGTDGEGHRIVRKGTDPAELTKLAVADARAIVAKL